MSVTPSEIATPGPRRAVSGDAFDAGFLAGLLDGEPVEEALALGCSCGALSTRAAGGTAAQPTMAEARAGRGGIRARGQRAPPDAEV
jgi:fructose-1-phosphate kinase PfkB-like protein